MTPLAGLRAHGWVGRIGVVILTALGVGCLVYACVVLFDAARPLTDRSGTATLLLTAGAVHLLVGWGVACWRRWAYPAGVLLGWVALFSGLVGLVGGAAFAGLGNAFAAAVWILYLRERKADFARPGGRQRPPREAPPRPRSGGTTPMHGTAPVKGHIPNEDLVLSAVPHESDDWGRIAQFAHTFDGYAHWGSFEACAKAARNKADRSLTGLRTRLFLRARAVRHGGYDPSPEQMIEIARMVREIRLLVARGSID